MGIGTGPTNGARQPAFADILTIERPHRDVLIELARLAGATARELAVRMGEDPARVQGLLDDLERRSYIVRDPSQEGRYLVGVQLRRPRADPEGLWAALAQRMREA
ncbi:MAG: MarR family transcriptional regulator [Acetobacteraceae bacterium]|nr:MarR family transcriptional regulator [Acetobacteraceae bacterium]